MTEQLPFHFSLSCIGEGNGNPLQCSCLENPRDGGGWWAAVYGVAQSRTRLKWLSSSSNDLFSASLVAQWQRIHLPMQETQVRSLGWADPLEKGLATHSSILAWRIPWTEEPGRLESVGSQKNQTQLGDWTTKTNWITVLHLLLLYSKVMQVYMCVYICMFIFFFIFFPLWFITGYWI